eukprot:scaffold3022_cov42-Cyclotella_meneghiniana.AAC.4
MGEPVILKGGPQNSPHSTTITCNHDVLPSTVHLHINHRAIAAYSLPEGDLAVQLSELMQCPCHVSFIRVEEHQLCRRRKRVI